MRTDIVVKDKSLGYAVKSKMVFKMPFLTIIPYDDFTGKCDRVDYNIIFTQNIEKHSNSRWHYNFFKWNFGSKFELKNEIHNI